MRFEELKNNLVCPYCEKPLNGESFSRGKWQCRKCGKLLEFETYRKFYPKATELRKDILK